MKNKLPVNDIYLAAFFDLKGITVELVSTGRWINFLVPSGNQSYKLIEAFNNNPTYPLLDYVSSLKKLRSQMIGMRKGGGQNER